MIELVNVVDLSLIECICAYNNGHSCQGLRVRVRVRVRCVKNVA